MKAPTSRYVKTDDGISIGFQVFGSGPYDLVINEGWMGNIDANWDMPENVGFYEALSRQARVIAFDRRGWGISDRSSDPDQVAIEKGMDDMRAVLDAVGSERPVVFGFEAGAAVSLLFTASYPERVAALILVAPIVRSSPDEGFPWGYSPAQVAEMSSRIESQWGTPEFWDWNMTLMGVPNVPADELERWARWSRLCASPSAALVIDRAEAHIDVRALLPTIRVPTLVLLKDGDRNSPYGAAPWVAGEIPGARFVELPGPEHWIDAKDVRAFEEIDAFVGQIQANEADLDRYLATVLFTDIVDSTAQGAALGDRAWSDIRAKHDQIVRSNLTRFRGREIKTMGDGFLATFDGPVRGVRCAEAIAEQVQPLGIEIRAGLHTGEITLEGDDIAGIGVAIGARVGAKARPSEVLVSQTVKDLVVGSSLSFEDAGEHELKGVPDRWRLYRVKSLSES
ncbi:MAG: adenylate/guanylate cyclase domain-containing protein [Actinomycetota bacterium]